MSRANAMLALAESGRPTLLEVLSRILEHPHREIVVTTPKVELEELSEPDTEGFLDLLSDPSSLAPAQNRPTHFEYEGREYHLTHVRDRRSHITFDTYPNRFVKYFLTRYRRAVCHSHTAQPSGDPASLSLLRTIDGLLANPALADAATLQQVSLDHTVLRKDPNYREVLRANLELNRLLARSDNVVESDE